MKVAPGRARPWPVAAGMVVAVLAASAWPQSPAQSPAQSPEQCRALEFEDAAAAEACYRTLLNADDPATRAEGAWALGDIPTANARFRAAVAAAPDRPELRVRWGELFLDAQNAAEAARLFEEALQLDPGNVAATLGLARVALGRFDARAEALANAALEAEPASHEARLILARLALEADDAARAEAELEGPLTAPDPRVRLEALALRSAMDHLADSLPSPWEEQAAALHPGSGRLYETIAHFYIITRRYREAVLYLTKAIDVEPTLWGAYATLGMNLLRVNRVEEGYDVLARAHDGFPYNLQVVNALRLLTDLRAWPENVGEGLILRVDPIEAGALSGYVREHALRAIDTFAERYAYRPDPPVVVELYRHHEDFAVRTSGLPGIGILGATFGNVVVMDGPSARGIDEGFDWASALWHEIAHVVTLGATDNRVARWFSEGISVYEEWQTGPSRFQVDGAPPGRRAVPLDVIDAFRSGKLLPIADLDEGFIRPRYPGQVGVSYTQAGLVCEFIAIAHGQEALREVLAGFAAGPDTARAIRTALDVPPESLDGAFDAYLRERFDGIDTEAFRNAARDAGAALEADDWPGVAAAATAAHEHYPYYVDRMSPYPVLAEAEAALGRRAGALDALRTYWQGGGRLTAPLAQLAAWLDDAGEAAEALAVRRSLALVAPFSGDHRLALGDALLAQGFAAEARREYAAHLSLKPHDLAGARYRLAQALFSLRELDGARREVLRALEIAPSYRDALDLLGRIVAASDGGASP